MTNKTTLKAVTNYREVDYELTKDEYYCRSYTDRSISGATVTDLFDALRSLELTDEQSTDILEHVIMYILVNPFTTCKDKRIMEDIFHEFGTEDAEIVVADKSIDDPVVINIKTDD